MTTVLILAIIALLLIVFGLQLLHDEELAIIRRLLEKR